MKIDRWRLVVKPPGIVTMMSRDWSSIQWWKFTLPISDEVSFVLRQKVISLRLAFEIQLLREPNMTCASCCFSARFEGRSED